MDNKIIIKCKKCGMPLKKGTKICSYCGQNTGHLINRAPKEKKEKGIQIGRHTVRIPWISLVLIILNAIAGIYKLAGGEIDIIIKYGMITGSLQRGEYLRLILSSFLHAGWLHFASNMYALVIYGFVFERRIPGWKYLLIYIMSMLGSALLINFIGGSALHIGASGAIWGLMTANLVYCLITKRKILYMLYAILAVAGNVVYTFSYGISWQGHLGGAITGILMALLLFGNERRHTRHA
ncbi:MAG: rhomboid family intramembrane serine protease [Clostridia bacterium]|nr:rhomboid family intramembrane serine protease [Clostridia bacterium]